jgi:hypothetical protein
MAASEHILLESDERRIPHPRCSRKVHARIAVQSRLRRRALQLELIDYYFLVVRLNRAGSLAAEYVLDLRFVDSSFTTSRHIASRWILAALALGALGTGIALRIEASAAPAQWLAACGVVLGMAAAATIVCLYRTTETVSLYSAHGRAKLLEFTSGLGGIRAFKPFTAKLAAHTKLALAARRPVRSEHLRDEMREHFRLRESGVLSPEEYEAGKSRILAEHAPSGTPSIGRLERLAPNMDGGWY